MYTAKITKWNFQYIDKSTDLEFYGECVEQLNLLMHLTKFYKSYVNDYEIKMLNKDKQLLQKMSESLLESIATIKEEKFYLFNKELRKKIQILKKDIDTLNLEVENINEKVTKLENSRFYSNIKLEQKFEKLLKDLGFEAISSPLTNGYTTTQMFEFNGNEKEMLEKAKIYKRLLEENLKYTYDYIKKDYITKQQNELSEELTF